MLGPRCGQPWLLPPPCSLQSWNSSLTPALHASEQPARGSPLLPGSLATLQVLTGHTPGSLTPKLQFFSPVGCALPEEVGGQESHSWAGGGSQGPRIGDMAYVSPCGSSPGTGAVAPWPGYPSSFGLRGPDVGELVLLRRALRSRPRWVGAKVGIS